MVADLRAELEAELMEKMAIIEQNRAVCRERDAAEHDASHCKEQLKAFRASAEAAKTAMREAQAVDVTKEGSALETAMKMEALYIKVAQLPGFR